MKNIMKKLKLPRINLNRFKKNPKQGKKIKLIIDKSLKNSKSLSKNILLISITTLVLTVLITSIVSLISLNRNSRQLSERRVKTSLSIIQGEFDDSGNELKDLAEKIAQDDNFINAFLNEDNNKIYDALNVLCDYSDNVTITDADGEVLLCKNGLYRVGDNIANDLNIKKALQGKESSGIGKNSSIYFSINAACPIKDENGNIVGIVSTSSSLQNAGFLGRLKLITDDDFSIFENDTRVNTTLVDNDNNRRTGTFLDSKIKTAVLEQKKEYIGKSKLFGANYITVYKPILDSDGNPCGVVAAATDYSSVENQLMINVFVIIGISILAVIISVIFFMRFLNAKVKKPLEKVVVAAKAIEIGELDENVMNELKSIKSKDEIGSVARSMEGAVSSVLLIAKNIGNYKKAIDEADLTYTTDISQYNGIYKTIVEIVGQLFFELGNILKEIKLVAEGIDVGSESVSDASQSLAQGATEQASSTEELAATISDIAEQIKKDSSNANGASSISEEAGKEVLLSSNYMNDMMGAMDEIKQTSGQIGKIIKTIDDIAFQTNILALNAAVEAARAGAAGKGFAVVADEVRNLANKSAEAAKSTTDLIESSAAAVGKGFGIAKETENALKNVVEKTNKVNDLVSDIAEALNKQSEGIYQINMGVEQISGVVQTNSANAEEIAASSEELAGQAHTLQNMVGKYKIEDQVAEA